MSTADNDIRDRLGVGPRAELPHDEKWLTITDERGNQRRVPDTPAPLMYYTPEEASRITGIPVAVIAALQKAEPPPDVVELVARAIYDAEPEPEKPFSQWWDWKRHAKAAIAAMQSGNASKNPVDLNTSGERAHDLNTSGISFDGPGEGFSITMGSMAEGVAKAIAQKGEALFRVVGKEDNWILALYVHPHERKSRETLLTKDQWADAILKGFQAENNRTKADEWEAAYAHLFKQLNEVTKQPAREISLVPVDDMDVEIAIAEAIAVMEPKTDYCETGVSILKYLKKHGWIVMQSKKDADAITKALNSIADE